MANETKPRTRRRTKPVQVECFIGVQYGLPMEFTARSLRKDVWKYLINEYWAEPATKKQLVKAGWKVLKLRGYVIVDVASCRR